MAKNLILFSDGTGNSSAKLFKTNVWRLYEAVDLGPTTSGAPLQIAFYDNGVGTQGVRLIAILSGIFGFGLKRNILRIYKFVCRNWAPGDEIYAFGFSRGAFTIRLVVSLILQKGLVQGYKTEAELDARARDALRDFGAANNPNFFRTIGTVGRALRDAWIGAKRALVGPRLAPQANVVVPQVRFMGVWDTVAAYGGPIAEITRGIDNLIWPLSMTDNCLNQRVVTARHALALDDERDSFHPVLWDEWDWDNKARQSSDPAFNDRLKQVWFTGMHSDVGGGYPDESLSYVSLTWMMDEAEAARLRLLPDLKKRIVLLSNSLGPVHDSRAGLAAYYRYQPRKIAAFLHPNSGFDFTRETAILRDPVLGEKQTPPHGQLLSCRIHESAIARICHGTDDYAPIVLPPKITIEPFSVSAKAGGANPIVGDTLKKELEKSDHNWWSAQEDLWDHVWRRRIWYFLSVFLTVLLVASPIWARAVGRSDPFKWIVERLTSWMDGIVPDFAMSWLWALRLAPIAFFVLIVAMLIVRGRGRAALDKLRGGSRRLWDARINGRPVAAASPSLLRRLRTGTTYQRLFSRLKWRLLPWLFGVAMIIGPIYLVAAAATQLWLSVQEPLLCRPGAPGIDKFSVKGTCYSYGEVARGRRYEIVFKGASVWADCRRATTPEGFSPGPSDPIHLLAAPFRRLLDARYMQPVLQIAPNRGGEVVRKSRFVGAIHLRRATGTHDYRGIITANEDGQLYVFANDVMLPFENGRIFYNNNVSNGTLTIRDLDAAAQTTVIEAEPAAPPALPETCL